MNMMNENYNGIKCIECSAIVEVENRVIHSRLHLAVHLAREQATVKQPKKKEDINE